MITKMDRLIAQAQLANGTDTTISDRLAREITDEIAHESAGGYAGSFVRFGWVPAEYAKVIQMHQALTFGETNRDLVMALARYLRMRHRNNLVGVDYGWDTP